MKRISVLIALLAFAACQKQTEKVTAIEDYNIYLDTNPRKTTSKYFELWNGKIKPDSIQVLSFGHVASEYNRYFKETGNINFLKKGERALTKAVAIAQINKEAYHRALARNFISQHRFKEALFLAEKAEQLGGGLKETQSLLFDVHMELGNYEKAKSYLDSITDLSAFGYLIRVAKWNDHKGDLGTTINFMEKAMAKAEATKNINLMLWSYTNIADYYGHAGRIKDSYQHYLKALELDNQNAYAKKGIAWIVYSYEKNPQEALRILKATTKYYHAPDYAMLKAEIADYMGDNELKAQYLDNFAKGVSNKKYGEMYNGYNVAYYLTYTNTVQKPLGLAKREVENRPTPESYNLLASVYYKNKEYQKALEVVDKHIMGRTYEPHIMLRAAQIYKANKKLDIVQEVKEELLGAGYELGPASKDQIESL